jgi:type I restriction enzyme S subunit
MTSEMVTRRIGELVSDGSIIAIQDGNHGELHPKASEYVPQGIPFIMASDVRGGRVVIEGAKRLPKARTDRLRIGFALPGDVLLTHKGTVGEVAIVPSLPDYIMLTPQVTYYRVNGDKLDARYLAYAFRSPSFQAQLANISAQSTRSYIGITTQRHLMVHWRPLEVQRRIACILGAYDDLIEVNRRRIALLEEIARRLFEEWFVRERVPQSQPVEFADLRLGEVAEVHWGDTQTTKLSYTSEGYVAYSASGPDGFMDHYDHEGLGIVLSAIGAQCGKIWLADGQWSCIKNTIFLKARPKSTTTRILYLALNRPDVWPKRGAAQPFISQGDARKVVVRLPPFDIQEKFDQLVAPIVSQARVLGTSNQVLAKSRDLLLPRLVSGELSVSSAQRELEAAA